MDIKKFFKSLLFAGEGLVAIFRSEQNFRIELVVGFVVIIMMFIFPLTIMERIVVGILIVNVLVMEIMNTILEYLLDLYSKRKNKKFKFLKDAMAGAVLLNVVVAVIAGLVIFGRYFWNRI